MTFKVGNLVKTTSAYPYHESERDMWEGGTVVDNEYDGFIGVNGPGGDYGMFKASELELVFKEVPSGASYTAKGELLYDTVAPSSDGGPSVYYDWPSGWNTLNDFIEHKSLHQWKEHSFHWGNVVKALTRWGDKDGTSCEYDAKKVIYSGCRVLKAIIGVKNLRAYLQKLLDDPQFKGKD